MFKMKRQIPLKWTDEEHQILVSGFEKYGPRPEAILRAYPSLTRSASSIKNKLKSIGLSFFSSANPILMKFVDELKKACGDKSAVDTNTTTPNLTDGINFTASPQKTLDNAKCNSTPIPSSTLASPPPPNTWTSAIDRFRFVAPSQETIVKIEEMQKLNTIVKPSYVQPFLMTTDSYWILTWANSEYMLMKFDVY